MSSDADELWLDETVIHRDTGYGYQCYDYRATSVGKDGTLTHVHERAGQPREEWTEHISESPYRDALPGWIWDLVLDPRKGIETS